MVFLVMITISVTAEELVVSIKKVMEDEASISIIIIVNIIYIIIIIITAEELVGSIKKAMEDEAMAANLERIDQIYMDREQKPVEKVTMMNMML